MNSLERSQEPQFTKPVEHPVPTNPSVDRLDGHPKTSTSWVICILLLVAAGGGLIFYRSIGLREARNLASGRQPDSDSDSINWPQLRGPTFDAISLENDLTDSWPDSGPPVLWTRELGQGYSSFAVVGDRLFTQCQSIYQQSVVCLDANTGSTLWSHNCGWPYEVSGLYPGPRSTPTWHAGRVYFATPDGTIGCLNAETGSSIWSCNPKKTYEGRGTDFGYACSPLVVDDRVIVPVGGQEASLVALDSRDGSLVWKSGTSPVSYATPLPITWNHKSLIVAALENSLIAVDAKTGALELEIPLSEGYDEHSSALLYRDPLLCLCSPFRAGAKCYELRMADVPTPTGPNEGVNSNENHGHHRSIGSVPKLKWELPKFSNDVASSTLVNGRLYGFDLRDQQSRLDRPSRGEFRCVDFETGQIVWSTNNLGQANAIAADQKLILFNDAGELILARLGTDEYSELARTQVFRDEICWTYPALHRGRLFLRTQTRAVCIYLGRDIDQTSGIARTVQDIPRGRILSAKWLIGGEREFPATVPEVKEFFVWYRCSLAAILLASATGWLSVVARRSYTWILMVCSKRHKGASNLNAATGCQSLDQSNFAETNQAEGIGQNERGTWIACLIYWSLLLVIGMAGSPLINARQNDYVLLWPLVLWTMFQLTVNVITITERHADRHRFRWYSRTFGFVFIGTCVLYFSLCRTFGYAIEWSFLVGFLPSFVFAVPAARCLTTQSRFWPFIDLIASVISFSGYFWLSVLFINWRFVVGS